MSEKSIIQPVKSDVEKEFFTGLEQITNSFAREAEAYRIAKNTLTNIQSSVDWLNEPHEPGTGGCISESYLETGFLCKEYIKFFEAKYPNWPSQEAKDYAAWLLRRENRADCGSGCSCIPEVGTTSRFVQNEVCELLTSEGLQTTYTVKKLPVKGTLCGNIEIADRPVQTFVVNTTGKAILQDIGQPTAKPLNGNFENNILSFNWNSVPNPHKVIVSYELY